MIHVPRSPPPRVLQRRAQQWLAAMQAARTPAEQKRTQAKYRHREIREALTRMFHGKCAYCESKITHVSDAHLEHYRPKSRFPELTFDWENLLLACGICNGTRHKGDRFPTEEEGGLLVNPCRDQPELHLEFDWDPVAGLASVYGKTVQGRTSVELLGLNRAALREYRASQVKRLAVLSRFAEKDPDARELLGKVRQADAEYAAFARRL